MRKHVVATTTAICLTFSAAVFAQTAPTPGPVQKDVPQACKDLTGAALDTCLKDARARSGDAAAASGAPGKTKSGTEATGGTAGGSGSGKGAPKAY